MSRRIPKFTAEASLYRTSVVENMTTGYRHPTTSSRLSPSSQIVPQVLQDPNRPRPPIIVKDSCRVICFYTAGRYRCTVVC
jgi:hypothetical protein